LPIALPLLGGSAMGTEERRGGKTELSSDPLFYLKLP
jgi:hypothetical protein